MRRKSARRTLEPRSATLPAFGWCVTNPNDPPADCSWCGRPLGVFPSSGITFCPACDCLPRPESGPAKALT